MSDPNEPKLTDPQKLRFNYIKSRLYRVIHVDGALGGPGPRGSVFVNFFSERLPIPRVQVFNVRPDRSLADERLEQRSIKEGVVREVEAAIVMDLTTARRVMEWLGETIARVEQVESELKNAATETDTGDTD